jgi:hypothetical protein
MQHDPDFTPDGKIILYDNRARIRNKVGTYGSRVVKLDPVTREVEVAYQGDPDEVFFSSQMGKQQPLDNGNILITEPDGGRAFEVTPAGEIVWDYINRWSADEVAVITKARRFPADFFRFPAAACE